VAVIGGGPAGLMAAETCARQGLDVQLYERMPSVGRKFLLAGKGGLNLTHAEPLYAFKRRYADRADWLAPMIDALDPAQLRDWARELGIETFVGTSGRVFPTGMKAAPLLRQWLQALRQAGVGLHMRHRWIDGTRLPGRLAFQHEPADGAARTVFVEADAAILALGGASWPRLGSDGTWVPLLRGQDVRVEPLRPANCGFDVGWTALFRERFAGAPVKSVALSVTPPPDAQWRRGEFVATCDGIEGSLVYTVAATLRERIARDGHARLWLDLLPDIGEAVLAERLQRPRGRRSLANHLRTRAGIDGVKAALLRETLDRETMHDMTRLASRIKALPLTLDAPRPITEAISTAGGVAIQALDARLMLRARPGVFCAGEMIDWEAPTGGYLLTACFATGRHAAMGAAAWLAERGR
ncbi:MAG: TIGR03862 family flavoprotein, partial [Burkholderiaceae bacterium]